MPNAAVIIPRRRGKAMVGSPELDFFASDKRSVLEGAQKNAALHTCCSGREVALHCRRPAAREDSLTQ